MKSLFYFLVFLVGSCTINEVSIVKSSQSLEIFKSDQLNEYLFDYVKNYKSPTGKTIYTVVFDSDTTAVFSQALYVERENLIGYLHQDQDILLFFGSSNVANRYLVDDSIRKDSITRFPYKEQIESLWPFDPIEKQYDLRKEVQILDFKGLNIPKLVDGFD